MCYAVGSCKQNNPSVTSAPCGVRATIPQPIPLFDIFSSRCGFRISSFAMSGLWERIVRFFSTATLRSPQQRLTITWPAVLQAGVAAGGAAGRAGGRHAARGRGLGCHRRDAGCAAVAPLSAFRLARSADQTKRPVDRSCRSGYIFKLQGPKACRSYDSPISKSLLGN